MSDDHVSGFDHHRAHALLPWWIDGTLDADERSFVEHPLHGCALCQDESELAKRMNEADVPHTETRSDVNAALTRVFERIDQEVPDQSVSRPARGSNVAWLSVAAAALLGFGALSLTYRYTLSASVSPLALSRVLAKLSVSDSVSKAALVEE